MPEIDRARALQLFCYDPDTGKMLWRVNRRRVRAGDVAGREDADGYRKTKTGGREYFVHRLAWLISYGSWPSALIDHINGNRSDNRLCNLREATFVQNQQNAKSRKRKGSLSALKGAAFCKQTSQWKASIRVGGKDIWLGRFNTEQEAHNAYRVAANAHFSEFARV